MTSSTLPVPSLDHYDSIMRPRGSPEEVTVSCLPSWTSLNHPTRSMYVWEKPRMLLAVASSCFDSPDPGNLVRNGKRLPVHSTTPVGKCCTYQPPIMIRLAREVAVCIAMVVQVTIGGRESNAFILYSTVHRNERVPEQSNPHA